MPKIIAKKEDWLKLGFKTFSQQGISGIVIEKMASKLNVNKSSFYWHFKTKKDFINEIINYWVANDTNNIIRKVDKQNTAKDKFSTLIKLVFKKDPYLDFMFFLKRYARNNKQIHAITNTVEKQRIDFVKNILLDLNFEQKDAEIKSKLFYKYLIGYHEMIRYVKQNKDYMKEVSLEINQFIKHEI